MEYFINSLKKAVKSMFITTAMILLLWGVLYHLTDFETITNYFWIGVAVCSINTVISNLRKRRIENILHVSGYWIIMAGIVLVLHHAGFTAAAVFAAAAVLVSPFFWASLYEGIVGLTLLIVLGMQM